MQIIEAIYDGSNFKLKQPIPVKEEYEVAITFIKPVKKEFVDIVPIKKRPRSEIIGLFKGKIWMSDDFNEPIEELKEYME